MDLDRLSPLCRGKDKGGGGEREEGEAEREGELTTVSGEIDTVDKVVV